MLYGRDVERARLVALLATAGAGRAGALVVRGEPGVGKSALLDDVAASAGDDLQVLRTQGLESESPLAFAALHRLLRPVLTVLDDLPAPQARALRVAFGQEEGAAVEPFLVALATLSMLTEAAERGPVLCIVDDAHWLDLASTDALLFAARRLEADRVAVVFSAREGDARTFVADGVASMWLTGLDAGATRSLLADRAGPGLPDEVHAALFDQTRGNPLALVELPGELSAEQLSGTAAIPAQLHLTAAVERVFLERTRRLPGQVQTLMLVTSADDSGSLAVVRRAAGLLGVPAEALTEAEQAGLVVTSGDTIRVRHPLVRSAVYQAATGEEQRAAHRALADALGSVDDPDRLAWHQAAAVDGPDQAAVDALEGAAVRAERRGGYVAAAAAYERAAELSARAQPRAALLFGAARNRWACGQAERAQALVHAAREGAEDRLLRADIDRLRGRIEVNVGSAANAYRIFTSAARAVAADDPARAVEMRIAATLTHLFDHDTGAIEVRELDAAQAFEPGPDAGPRLRCLAHLLDATTADLARRWPEALVSHRAAMAASTQIDDLDVLANLGNTALHLGDDDAHRLCFTRMLSEARDRGAGMSVLYALPRLAFADLLSGRWAQVREAAEEALSLSAGVGQRALGAAPIAWLVLLAALQGRPEYDELRSRLDDAARQPLGVLTDPIHDLTRWADGVRALNDADPVRAVHHLRRLRVPALARMAAIDRIGAAVRAGDDGLAREWIDDVAEFAEATRWPWALAAADHGRALLADPLDAPGLFDSALAQHASGGRPYDRARTHLAYGELLRRSQRRVDARLQLRAALVVLEELTAEPLVARAAQELRASGETARKRDPSTLVALTPMERQVAQLVAQGLSNKEVAAQCWISPRTVAFHLRNAFTKTGVTSRGELAQLHLPRSAPADLRS